MFDGEAPRDGSWLRRYWLLTSEPPGFGGGIGVYTHQTARMFAGRGVAVTVLHHDPTTLDPVVGWRDGYRLIRFGGRGLDRRPIPHANLQGPLRASREASCLLAALIADEGPPDILECQDYAALAHAFLKHRLMHPQADWPRVVLTAHRPHLHCLHADGDSTCEHTAAFLGDMERWCYAAADAVLSPCCFILEPLAALGFPVERAEVVANPFDPDEPPAGGSALGPEALELSRRLHTPDEPVLVFAKLQRQKGVPDLLASLDALHTHSEAPPAWLFGRDAFLSGSATTTYDDLRRRHARLFDARRVRYFGGYTPADIARLCRGHPVVALPYLEDCLPYAFVEAVLAGALPLTSEAGGQLELVPADLRQRLTAPATEPDLWGQRARDLLRLDPSERALLSARMQASVRARTDPGAVYARKLELLQAVRPTYRAGVYPFVQAPTTVFADEGPAARAALAKAVPQRGETRDMRSAGPARVAHPDLVSVIVPFHEMQAFVGETLASIEAQDHGGIEVVVVDDGSRSTEARTALDALLNAPRRFPTRVLHKTNGGLADARNAGARVAQGAYLYFLDADDVIHPSLIGRSLRLLKRYANVAYVGPGLREFGESDGEWAVHDVDGAYLGFHNVQICAFLVRAEAWLRHGVNDLGLHLGMEDYDSHLGLYAAGARGIAIPEPLFGYRKRAGSMSKAFDPHGVAYLYRRIWGRHPELLRRFGPELVGLHAENGHGALAPAVCEPSPAHRALLGRDLPDLGEMAHDLEAQASHERLSRTLRGRCGVGGPEWDYTAARFLLALDEAPAFARQMLRGCLAAEPGNGWFRLYAIIAELRDGRIGAADALWTDGFCDFCCEEAGSLDWVTALEAVRGFPHVALTLKAWSDARADVRLATVVPDIEGGAASGPFADIWTALCGYRAALAAGSRAIAAAEATLREAAAERLSSTATTALAVRWRRTWINAGLLPGRPDRPLTFWGRTADAYLDPAVVRTADASEQAAQAAWAALRSGHAPAVERPWPRELVRKGLTRLARGEAQRVSATASRMADMM